MSVSAIRIREAIFSKGLDMNRLAIFPARSFMPHHVPHSPGEVSVTCVSCSPSSPIPDCSSMFPPSSSESIHPSNLILAYYYHHYKQTLSNNLLYY